MTVTICVVGAGVIGLSTALRIRHLLPSVEVCVVASSFDIDTTSDGAAGLWEPYKLGDTPVDRINTWAAETYHLFQELYDSRHCAVAGMTQVPLTGVQTEGHEAEPPWRDIPGDFRPLTSPELQRLSRKGGKQYTAGYTCTTLMCEGRAYLPYLTQKLQQLGVQIKRQFVRSLQDLAAYDVIVNCSGLGARQLVPDPSMVPIRGHVIRVRAPWVKEAFFEDEDKYVLPNRDTVVLGGTGQVGEEDLQPWEADRAHIWRSACALMPSLSQAEVVSEWVGLRPGRPTVRLDVELREATGSRQGQKPLKIVHNYGHGGAGITLHWGCAGEAARLVHELLDGQSRPGLSKM